MWLMIHVDSIEKVVSEGRKVNYVCFVGLLGFSNSLFKPLLLKCVGKAYVASAQGWRWYWN